MTRATLADVLLPALANGRAVAGFVVQGWEDARAYVNAAEALGRPVILQAGPGARAHMPLAVLGAMFVHLSEGASVPVVAHLDHGDGPDVCRAAIDCGFTSVMFDGSALPLEENIAQTAGIAAMAHKAGVSVEAELGYVGYHGGAASRMTDPEEVARFARETQVDALAVSVGNDHLMPTPGAEIDLYHLTLIAQAAPGLPLVLHGGSGIAPALRARIARETSVCKFNIGTELRQAFGASLRGVLAGDPGLYDRNLILRATMPQMQAAAEAAIRSLG
jgi:fructose-bisphosphate aldolase, class II